MVRRWFSGGPPREYVPMAMPIAAPAPTIPISP